MQLLIDSRELEMSNHYLLFAEMSITEVENMFYINQDFYLGMIEPITNDAEISKFRFEANGACMVYVYLARSHIQNLSDWTGDLLRVWTSCMPALQMYELDHRKGLQKQTIDTYSHTEL